LKEFSSVLDYIVNCELPARVIVEEEFKSLDLDLDLDIDPEILILILEP